MKNFDGELSKENISASEQEEAPKESTEHIYQDILTPEQEEVLKRLKETGNSEELDAEKERLNKEIARLRYFVYVLEGWIQEDILKRKK